MPQQIKNGAFRFGRLAHEVPPYKIVGKQNHLFTGNSTAKIPQAVAFWWGFTNF
jgi:hypothetical protein